MYTRFLNKILLVFSWILIQTSPIQAKPLKVFILCGQSNMQGHAKLSTFPAVGNDPKTADMYKEMVDAEGKPIVCKDVYISYLTDGGWRTKRKPIEKNGPLTAGFGGFGDGSEIGPEFTFGIYMNKFLNEPILIIKTAWGGKDLHTDFRSPSSGPFDFPKPLLQRRKREGKDPEKVKADKIKDTGHFYRLMIDQVKKVLANPKKYHPAYNEKDGYKIAGFVWFQGFNDLHSNYIYPGKKKPDRYKFYSELLANFIRDVRKDLKTPKLPFVIGVLGVEGDLTNLHKYQSKEDIEHFRNAMAAPAEMDEFKGNVAAVRTEKYWDKELGSLNFRWEKNVKMELDKLRRKKKLTNAQIKSERQKLNEKEFTKEELEALKLGKSNGGYHYLGSAKILAQIGKAFAEAMNKMEGDK